MPTENIALLTDPVTTASDGRIVAAALLLEDGTQVHVKPLNHLAYPGDTVTVEWRL